MLWPTDQRKENVGASTSAEMPQRRFAALQMEDALLGLNYDRGSDAGTDP
jgi:hypothetical protein